MTAQIGDRIDDRGRRYTLFANPLEALFEQGYPRPNFPPLSTACWRGYVAHWRIHNDKLELMDVQSGLPGRPPSTTTSLSRVVDQTDQPWVRVSPSLTAVFPEAQPPIAATWYSGLLEIPLGQCVNYVHMGYDSTYEQHMYLHIYRGQLIYREVRNGNQWSRCECELLARPEGVSSDEEWAFFQAMSQADDYTPHLLYADWLDEYGRSELAIAVRQKVARRHKPDTDSDWLGQARKVSGLWKWVNHSLVFALTNAPLSREVELLRKLDHPRPTDCLIIRDHNERRHDTQRGDQQHLGQSSSGQQSASED